MKLILILGDQLWLGNPALQAADRQRDRVLMVEAPEESTLCWSSKPRTVMFLAAMRHFAEALREDGWKVEYLSLGTHPYPSLDAAWQAKAEELGADALWACEPGEWRIERMLEACAQRLGLPLRVFPDPHFLISREAFRRWAGSPARAGAKPKFLLMEHFYRHMRKQTGVLLDAKGQPAGGRWNFDADNRAAFGRDGPGALPAMLRFPPDRITQHVIGDVERVLPEHPGQTASFAWPVTREQALAALADFIEHRLPYFGRFQDAMWTAEPFLHHSLISAALNLHLLDPREVIAAVVSAYEQGLCDLASAEGYVRQILGWREFMRGVYWLDMPGLAQANHFQHERALPGWYWTGATEMRCLREAITQTLEQGYAHHIQRLMLTGNFALIAGLSPQAVAQWYLAVYIDAVEWVELPNTAGMALYANGGRFTSKPYAASGAYVQRMSNYCQGCRYRPEHRTGPQACPITVFYWDFLARHRQDFAGNPRMVMMLRHLDRMGEDSVMAIRRQAQDYAERIEQL